MSSLEILKACDKIVRCADQIRRINDASSELQDNVFCKVTDDEYGSFKMPDRKIIFKAHREMPKLKIPKGMFLSGGIVPAPTKTDNEKVVMRSTLYEIRENKMAKKVKLKTLNQLFDMGFAFNEAGQLVNKDYSHTIAADMFCLLGKVVENRAFHKILIEKEFKDDLKIYHNQDLKYFRNDNGDVFTFIKDSYEAKRFSKDIGYTEIKVIF